MNHLRPLAVGLLLAVALFAASGCGDSAPDGVPNDGGKPNRFLTPATTFTTYRRALQAVDADAAWACLADGYRRHHHEDDPARFRAFLDGSEGAALRRRVGQLAIADEVEIDRRVGYLRFDPSTVESGQAPFFYFLREPDGWKITTHLDSLFRARLEAAIADGALPLGRH